MLVLQDVTADSQDLSFKPRNPERLRSLPHRQAVDLFHATKAKIVASARSSGESIRLLGPNNFDSFKTPRDAESLVPVPPQRAFVKHNIGNIKP